MRRNIKIKSNHLTDAENDNIKEQIIADIQWNETVALNTDDTLKRAMIVWKLLQQKMNTMN